MTHRRLLALACLAAALAGSGCLGRLAGGTSSGVDNPGVVVAFVDSLGAPLAVTGDLDVFARDQNPVLRQGPLWTLKVRDSARATLTAEDFRRMAAKRAASGAAAVPAGFNLAFTGGGGEGVIRFGLAFDEARGRFSEAGEPVAEIRLTPRGAQAFHGGLDRSFAAGEVARAFIPGTRHVATVVGSAFLLPGLPPGAYPLRLVDSLGRVYAVRESLDTRAGNAFTVMPAPVDSLAGVPDRVFSLNAGPDREAFRGTPVLLQAELTGDLGEGALSSLWRVLGRADTARDSIHLAAPDQPTTSAIFGREGAYRLEVAATSGLRTLRDTVLVAVREPPPAAAIRVVQPRPGDVLMAGEAYPVMWDLPSRNTIVLSFSSDGGATWMVLENAGHNPEGPPVFLWTPLPGQVSANCLLRVQPSGGTAQATMTGVFEVRGQ